MSDAIVVAVRCRPFNKRELALGAASSCVEMRGGTTILHDNSKKEEPKKFTFDYSYWSTNSDDAHYATNTTVYADLGTKVLDNALEGYNCCLFAYGQTGSGTCYICQSAFALSDSTSPPHCADRSLGMTRAWTAQS